MPNRFAIFCCAIATLIFLTPAAATELLPNSFAETNSTTLDARPELDGEIIEDISHPFSVTIGDAKFSGVVQERVVREYGTGTLDFYHRIFNDADSVGYVDFVTRTSFANFSTDVDWRLDLDGAIHPNGATRSDGAGAEVLFDQLHENLLYPGVSSPYVFVKTDAVDYAAGGLLKLWYFVPGGPTGSVDISVFQPVPEPSSVALVATGALGLALWRWRRARG